MSDAHLSLGIPCTPGGSAKGEDDPGHAEDAVVALPGIGAREEFIWTEDVSLKAALVESDHGRWESANDDCGGIRIIQRRAKARLRVELTS